MRQKRTAENQDRFLAMVREVPVIKSACEAADVPRTTVYRWLDNEAFAERFTEAREVAVESLEKLAWDWARGAGKLKPNTALLIFLLKAGRPEVYRDRVAIMNPYVDTTPSEVTFPERVIDRAGGNGRGRG